MILRLFWICMNDDSKRMWEESMNSNWGINSELAKVVIQIYSFALPIKSYELCPCICLLWHALFLSLSRHGTNIVIDPITAALPKRGRCRNCNRCHFYYSQHESTNEVRKVLPFCTMAKTLKFENSKNQSINKNWP